MNEYLLPKDTYDLIKNKSLSGQFSNVRLLLQKFPRFQDKKFVILDKYDYKEADLKNSALVYYWQKNFDCLRAEFCVKPDWRLILGLGSESVYETSITLHHTYGFPVIPGQSLKGILRNYLINRYFSDDLKKASSDKHYNLDEAVEKDELFSFIFGNQSNQGKIIFFDALPATVPRLVQDIMNPHYGKYYSGNNPPADNQNPIPVIFLTVEDTPFIFSVGIKTLNSGKFQDVSLSARFQNDLPDNDVLKFVKCHLMAALSENGIGSKTAIGYGSFSEEISLPPEFLSILEEIEKLSKSDKEKQEDQFREVMAAFTGEFNLFAIKEKIRNIGELCLYQDYRKLLLNSLLDAITNPEHYQNLNSDNERWDLLNSSNDFKNFLIQENELALLDDFYSRFEKIIKKFASKKKVPLWLEEKKNWLAKRSS